MTKNRIQGTVIAALALGLISIFLLTIPAQAGFGNDLKEIDDLTGQSAGEMRDSIESFTADRASLTRTYPDSLSPQRRARLQQFYHEWRGRLASIDFEKLGQDGRIDYLLFRNYLERELRQLDLQATQWTEVEPLVPFAKTVFELDEARRKMQPVNSPKAAALLNEVSKQIEEMRRNLGAGPEGPADSSKRHENTASQSRTDNETRTHGAAAFKVKKIVANRAATTIISLRATLRNWFEYYNGYDPNFSWWVAEPYKTVDQALQSYASFMSEKLAGVRFAEGSAETRTGRGDGPEIEPRPDLPRSRRSARAGDASDIVGDPIGRDALLTELAAEMIPYTPEELLAIANQEMAWCETELKKAARDLGYGDDWHKALEYVKGLYVEPGKQPQLILDLAVEAIGFVDQHDLVTVPPLARESWRMQMMSPERQLVNPFFTGGETISVSYPTNSMSHEQKLMSMRGNNIHFARATVFHELIPGHHLQGFMSARYKAYRAPFRTPFWGEGWALYWEMLMWDMGFAKTPENRIGMLFWRMHRCARIIFSLSFHLGRMSPGEAIDFLVQRVGHEVENATAEVRRSFDGTYAPLYQAAYLLGGLQIYSLHRELVGYGKMTNRAFHDAILKENSIPIELVRASLTKQKLTRGFVSTWTFYGPHPQ